MDWNEFFSFRRMVTPAVIEVIFWLLILADVFYSIRTMTYGGWGVLIGIVMLVVGAVLIRVYCELIILLFRIYDSLRHIEGKTDASLM